MRALLIVGTLALLAAVPAAQESTKGTIVGHVRLTSRIKGAALRSNTYQPRAITNHDAVKVPEIKNVVVYLKNPVFRGALPATKASIRQEHESFSPRVVAVTRGSTVEFPNFDPIFHNVFSLSSAASFDLGRYPMGRSKTATFTKPGLVKVFCHIHSEMSATIMVLDHPYFTTPDLEGDFTLADVPAGHYTVAGWHERVGERLETVEVAPGSTVHVTLSLPVEDTP